MDRNSATDRTPTLLGFLFSVLAFVALAPVRLWRAFQALGRMGAEAFGRPLARDTGGQTSISGLIAGIFGLVLTIISVLIGLNLMGANTGAMLTDVADINSAITSTSTNDTTVDSIKGSFTSLNSLAVLGFVVLVVTGFLVVRD